jgi:hypothetical protein
MCVSWRVHASNIFGHHTLGTPDTSSSEDAPKYKWTRLQWFRADEAGQVYSQQPSTVQEAHKPARGL